MLSKHPEKCRFPHGHTRKVEFVVEAPSLDANEMVCDFKAIKDLIADFLESYDHSLCMNTHDPEFARMKTAYGERVIGFEGSDPTTEAMAQAIHSEFSRRFDAYAAGHGSPFVVRPEVKLVKVRVWETSSSWAEYWE